MVHGTQSYHIEPAVFHHEWIYSQRSESCNFFPRANAETGAAESNKWSAESFLPTYAHLFNIWPAVEHKVKQGEPTAQWRWRSLRRAWRETCWASRSNLQPCSIAFWKSEEIKPVAETLLTHTLTLLFASQIFLKVAEDTGVDAEIPGMCACSRGLEVGCQFIHFTQLVFSFGATVECTEMLFH